MYSQVRALLTDTRFDWSTRRVRLSGWRGNDAEAASKAGWRLSVGPAFCAVTAVGFGILGQPLLLGALAATAAVGAIRGSHPIESLYNATLGRRGTTIPTARAARAFGCFMGALMLAGSAIAFAAGLPTLGLVFALTLGGLAAFVAITRVCVPSMMFVLLFGARRSEDASLARAMLSSRITAVVAS